MVRMRIWRDESTPTPEERVVPYGLAQAYGLNAGFYKVQATEKATGILLCEWKQPLG